MKRNYRIIALLLTLLFVLGGSAHSGELFQVSAFAPFAQGGFDGQITFRELRRHGNLGIGTLNGLFGEMIALDGQFHQIRTDGKVYSVDDSELTPFAMVVEFKPDQKHSIPELNESSKLYRELDSILPNLEAAYAVKIQGEFNRLKVRSVPKQEKPYPTLEAAIKNQSVFELKNVKGTLVGFRFPDYITGMNTPGYHFHFITDDKTAGGHVLECDIKEGRAEIELVSSLQMEFNAVPASAEGH